MLWNRPPYLRSYSRAIASFGVSLIGATAKHRSNQRRMLRRKTEPSTYSRYNVLIQSSAKYGTAFNFHRSAICVTVRSMKPDAANEKIISGLNSSIHADRGRERTAGRPSIQ